MQSVETKLAAARTKLILDKPFLGALVLRLPMKAANKEWCPTVATDARAFYYNTEYIEELTLDQTQFMLAHEALHCALSHFARRQHRVKHKWDIACDLAINPLLLKEGLKPPPGVLLESGFEDMTAEEIEIAQSTPRYRFDATSTPPPPVAAVEPEPAGDIPSPMGWRHARFRLKWPEGEEPAWHWDLAIARDVVAPVLNAHGHRIRLWRFHRRAARDNAGHRFPGLPFPTQPQWAAKFLAGL